MKEKNANKINNFLAKEEKVYLNYQTLINIPINMAMTNIWTLFKRLLSFNWLERSQSGSLISIDKSLFVKSNRVKICFIGPKNNKTFNIRIDISILVLKTFEKLLYLII